MDADVDLSVRPTVSHKLESIKANNDFRIQGHDGRSRTADLDVTLAMSPEIWGEHGVLLRLTNSSCFSRCNAIPGSKKRNG